MALREEILNKAINATMGDRNISYGDPFDNLQLAGQLKALYAKAAGNKYCEAHDEAIELLLTKVARIATGAVGHSDSYVDGAAYFAIAAECQDKMGAVKLPEFTPRTYTEFARNEGRLKFYKARIDVFKPQGVSSESGMVNPYRKKDADQK